MKKISSNQKFQIFITIVGILLSSIFTYFLTRSSELDSRKYESDKKALTVVLENTLKYSNYSTVDWEMVDKLYYHPYHLCEFHYIPDPEVGENADISEIICRYFERLQNAKNDFRKLTTEARIIGSPKINNAVVSVENGFDDVFQKILTDKYYMRVFVDSYNAIMPEKFVELEKVFQNEFK